MRKIVSEDECNYHKENGYSIPDLTLPTEKQTEGI